MAQRPTDRADAAAVIGNEFLRGYLERAEFKLFQQWQRSETVEDREALHAQHKALTNIRSKLYADCQRLVNGESLQP